MRRGAATEPVCQQQLSLTESVPLLPLPPSPDHEVITAQNGTEVKSLTLFLSVFPPCPADYEEFLAATIHASKLEHGDRLVAAFRHFDKDGDGHISCQELHEVGHGEGWVAGG